MSASRGFLIGHWTDHDAQTGCTVVLFDGLTPAVVDVRGGAPGTRETHVLDSSNLVRGVDAILMTGGSAFGLAAADGVMGFLRDRGRGVPTSAGAVPIVSAAVLFDLGVGKAVAPNAQSGLLACEAAVTLDQAERGLIGAGRGLTTNKLARGSQPVRGGIGIATQRVAERGSVTAIVAVNSVGTVAGTSDGLDPRLALMGGAPEPPPATTIATVIIDGAVDRRTLERCAISAHDAFARVIVPCHTIFDGDTVFVAGLAQGDQAPEGVLAFSLGTELAVERAIIDAVSA